MADYVQKVPLARTLNQFAARKVFGAMDLFGKALPASVVKVVSSGIVTVKFEVANTPNSPYTFQPVTVPLFGPEYVRYPIQVGCKGFVISSDAYLGGMSGLGGGVADLARRGNLSALVFVPFGNTGWTASEDPNALVLYGPDGVIIRTADGTSKITANSNGVTIAPPSGKPTAIQSDAQLTGQIKNPGGGTYSQPITTTADVTGQDVNATANVVAGAMVSGATAAFGAAAVGGAEVLTANAEQNLNAGFTETEYDNGTPANGATVVIDALNGQKQKITNDVAGFTVSVPVQVGDVELRIINGASAGTITVSGGFQYPGSSGIDTVNGDQFVMFIFNFGSTGFDYIVRARQ